MSQPKWTKEQKQAIDVRKGTLLLAAAAGSGKTAVLVQRVIDILTDPTDPVEPRQLLVVTFTNAAAAQMNQRIAEYMQQLLSEDPTNAYLRKQMALLSAAQISTVHSYCMNLIRANFHLLGIQPDVRLGDQNDMNLLSADLLEECIEDFYQKDAEENNTNFDQLVKLFRVKGDDRQLGALVKKVYSFLRSRPFYLDWLDESLAAYDNKAPLLETVWGKIILDYARASIRDIKAELLSTDSKEADRIWAEEFEQVLNNGNWDDMFRFVQSHLYEKRSNANAAAFAKELGESLFCCNEEAFHKDLQHLKPIITTLFDLVKEFDKRYAAEKQRRHLLDFADLEHFAIQLLVEKQSDGSYAKTALAKQLSEELRYVLVDEYQDTNQTQSLIFQSLSKEDNLFMVGDIKQSIYRFRQADPSIFLGKKRDYCDYDGEHFPAKLFLSNNFRSRKEVTDSINYIFSQIMKEETAEMDYSEGEHLVPSASYPESDGFTTEYHIIESTSLRTDGAEAAQQEAFVVAAHIKKLLNSGMLVTDHGEQRPLEPKDICILLRSPKSHGDIFLQALVQENISVISEVQQNFLDTIEISTILSLLRSIENPLLDIHLTAALMSAAFRFTADDMARLRIHDRQKHLYLNCLELAKAGNSKCAMVVDKLQDYRLHASAMPSWQFLQYVLDDSGLMSFASALENGSQRQANLRLLIEYAKNCEDWGYAGLAGFLRYMDRVSEREEELSSAPPALSQSSAVRIMSIHKSKGLEFPVVFLCETSRKFNTKDLTQDILLHPDQGFACISNDPSEETSFTTTPLEALRLSGRFQMQAEEMRILYVAMTRAKEKLIITSVQKSPKKTEEMGRASNFEIRQATSYAQWLDIALRDYDERTGLFRIIKESGEGSADREEKNNAIIRTAEADESVLQYLRTICSLHYSDPAASKIPSKLTVTEISKGQRSQDDLFSKEPEFLKEHKMTAAQRGTVMHNFLSCADHSAAEENLEQEIQRMTAARYFTGTEAASLNRREIRAYYASDLYTRIKSADWVKREFSFLMDMGREELSEVIPEIGSHRITVQGIADLIFEENGAIILVDYKTDHLPEEEIVEKYRPQLTLYRSILNRLLNKDIKETLIYSMYHKKTLKI